MRILPLLVAMVVLAAGCGVAGPPTSPHPAGPGMPSGPVPAGTPQRPAGPTAASTARATEKATAVPSEPAPSGSSRAAELGLDEIQLTTPISGGGRRPVLEWAPLTEAAHYHVLVRAPSGRVYWGWRTSGTSIPVGGLPRLTENAAGPAISIGMSWSVSAVDADGRVIGLSGQRPISP